MTTLFASRKRFAGQFADERHQVRRDAVAAVASSDRRRLQPYALGDPIFAASTRNRLLLFQRRVARLRRVSCCARQNAATDRRFQAQF